MGAFNCRLQNVHTPTTGVALSHFTNRRLGFGMGGDSDVAHIYSNFIESSIQHILWGSVKPVIM
jgi:hypothetical protein